MFEEPTQLCFPSLDLVKLLIECGSPINSVNHEGNTPLHLAVEAYNFQEPVRDLVLCMKMFYFDLFLFKVVKYLLRHGAHVDSVNQSGHRPSEMMKQLQDCKINPLDYQTLKCLAAAVVRKQGIPFDSLPMELKPFTATH